MDKLLQKSYNLRVIERQSKVSHFKFVGLPLWAWPTALSLDAPLVAILWQSLFAASYDLVLAWYYPAILGLSVWLIYAGDRLLDSLSLDLTKPHTYRHAFYTRYRKPFSLVWMTGFITVTILAFSLLPEQDLMVGLGLSCAVTLYMLGTHSFKALSLSKEGLIGLIFGVAASLPLWAGKATSSLGFATLLFALLASLNCLLIAFWELETDTLQDQLSSLRTAPKLTWIIAPLLIGLGTVSLTAGLIIPLPLALSITLSALLMLTIKRYKNVDTELRRVLADVALLTPLIFLGIY